MKPCDCINDKEVAALKRGSLEFDNFWTITDGFRVTIAEQRDGEKPIQEITMTPRQFNKIVRWWTTNQT